MRPKLRGCINNDICPSWLWSMLEGLDEVEDESQEVTEAQEEVARAKYEEYKKQFAENHYTRRSPLIRKNFGEFLETALEDIPPPDSDDNSDDEISLTDDDEEEELSSETDSLGSLSGSMEPSSAPPGLGVHFEINPELLSQENVPAKEDSPDPKSESPSAENLAVEYRDLIAPIWALFFPNDSDPDTEVSQ
ncbi:Hypothetical protein NCS54_00135000 [Fusarium falciforme]|uniref:Hypothetical protein n=1 Tax=Fusarium falciforme TaxID=195108 RepID=UPI0022FFD912|nr:Hypothetical protein NCS54_00135000 [Fusarium falciforme]WAO84144.1 Hypothetical protein NCS54_00135000 [Fusarium falciforme]